jgi:signal transduction histidine kinase
MPPDVLTNALLPFYSTKPAGSGLGLTLCREIVEAHGGTLEVGNRAEGAGVIVRIWLPPAPSDAFRDCADPPSLTRSTPRSCISA